MAQAEAALETAAQRDHVAASQLVSSKAADCDGEPRDSLSVQLHLRPGWSHDADDSVHGSLLPTNPHACKSFGSDRQTVISRSASALWRSCRHAELQDRERGSGTARAFA